MSTDTSKLARSLQKYSVYQQRAHNVSLDLFKLHPLAVRWNEINAYRCIYPSSLTQSVSQAFCQLVLCRQLALTSIPHARLSLFTVMTYIDAARRNRSDLYASIRAWSQGPEGILTFHDVASLTGGKWLTAVVVHTSMQLIVQEAIADERKVGRALATPALIIGGIAIGTMCCSTSSSARYPIIPANVGGSTFVGSRPDGTTLLRVSVICER